MLLAKDNFTFIDNAHRFYNTIVNNICKFNNYAEITHIKLVLIKIGYLFVSDEFIKNNINFDESMQIVDKVKYVFDNINDENIRSKFKPYYEQLKITYMNDLIKDYTPIELINMKSNYPEIFENNDVDFKIYVNHKKNAQDHISTDEMFHVKNIKDIDLVYTYKFKIESPYINHSFELFPVQYDDFFSIVARFHLPCVRGLYNGNNVYLTPSCISAHMTYMNIDYKYVCGTKDPIEIINKNRMRGFGTWLNASEKKIFIKYSKEIPVWNNLYKITGSTGPVTYGSTGPVTHGPVTHGSTGPVTYGSTGPVTYGSTGPVTYGSTGPVTHGSTGPVTHGSTGPDTYGSTGPDNYAFTGPDNYAFTGPDNYAFTGPDNYAFTGPVTHGSSKVMPYNYISPVNNIFKESLHKKVGNTMDKIIFLGPLSLNHKMFKPRLYNTDEYNDSMYVDTSNRYNNYILPPTICEYNKSNIRNNFNYEENINYNSLTAISSCGSVVPLKKYVIKLTWKIYIKNKKLENKKLLVS
jgi:hypothetical protein